MADFTNFAFVIKLNSSEIIQLAKILFVLHKKWYVLVSKLVHIVIATEKVTSPRILVLRAVAY